MHLSLLTIHLKMLQCLHNCTLFIFWTLRLPLFCNKLKFISISALFFCATEIISTARIHLYLALLFRRDYFDRFDSSLSCFSAPQGLFQPARFISILLFCSTGIISTARIHLYPALFHHRDYFDRPDSSLSCFSVPQGLFRLAGCIPAFLFFTAGIISPRSDTSLIAETISARPFRRSPI